MLYDIYPFVEMEWANVEFHFPIALSEETRALWAT